MPIREASVACLEEGFKEVPLEVKVKSLVWQQRGRAGSVGPDQGVSAGQGLWRKKLLLSKAFGVLSLPLLLSICLFAPSSL